MPISQVALSNTFNEFRTTFNDAANTLNSYGDYTGSITANTITAYTLTSGNVNPSNLTTGRVVLKGTTYLEDDSGLTFNTTTNALTVGGTTTSGNVTSQGTLSVTGVSTLTGAVNAQSTLAVSGATTLSSTLAVTGNATVGTNKVNIIAANGDFMSTGNLNLSGATSSIDAYDIHATDHVGVGGELSVWVAAKGDTQSSHRLYAIANTNGPQDVLVVNQSDGANAYGEFIAIHHSGNTDQGWISMGINSTNYAEGAYGVTKAEDGYVLYQAPAGTVKTGDLVIGTGGNGTHNRIIFSADGFDDPANNTQLVINPGQNIHIEIDTESSNTTTGALTVNGGIGLVGNLNIGGNVAITGTITLGGGGNTVSTSSLQVDNPIIFVANNNAADVLDVGVVGQYTATGTKYNGFVRDASDSGKWKLFSGIANKPANTVNFTGATYDTLYLGAIESVSTTASSSTTTGAIVTAGGLGVAGAAYVGGVLRNTDSTASTTSSTGATVVTGGLGVGGAINGGSSISDSKGNVREVPLNATTGTYTLAIADSGKTVTATGNVTVPASVFSAGQVVTIYNNSASSISILQGASATLRQAGTSNTGTRTLAQRGICTVLCVASNEFVINGGGLT